MILMRLRRSLPAMAASTVVPASSSMENIPARNFSTTLPITSIESSFDKLFLFPFPRQIQCLSRVRLNVPTADKESRQDRTTAVGPDYRKMPKLKGLLNYNPMVARKDAPRNQERISMR